MTSEEFQTVTDLQRVRLIKAELDALEASENVGAGVGHWLINNTELQAVRADIRTWERKLQESISIRKKRSDAQLPFAEAK